MAQDQLPVASTGPESARYPNILERQWLLIWLKKEVNKQRCAGADLLIDGSKKA